MNGDVLSIENLEGSKVFFIWIYHFFLKKGQFCIIVDIEKMVTEERGGHKLQDAQ